MIGLEGDSPRDEVRALGAAVETAMRRLRAQVVAKRATCDEKDGGILDVLTVLLGAARSHAEQLQEGRSWDAWLARTCASCGVRALPGPAVCPRCGGDRDESRAA